MVLLEKLGSPWLPFFWNLALARSRHTEAVVGAREVRIRRLTCGGSCGSELDYPALGANFLENYWPETGRRRLTFELRFDESSRFVVQREA